MKSTPALLIAAAALVGPACSLVTVPVKVAGSIVETTVTTTGDVVTAPFNALGGGKRNDTPKPSDPGTPSPDPDNPKK